MATPSPYRYDVDETGINPNNLVENEPQTLAARVYRAIAPKYGAYFTRSLRVWDALTRRELRKEIDYKCLDIVGLPSARNNNEICSTILIIDKSCSPSVLITYQALGGPYERSFPGIITLIENVYSDSRAALWESVIGKPGSFNPTDHMHDFGDIIGLEYVINAMERIRQAILLGDEVDNVQLSNYFDAQLAKLRQDLNTQVQSESYQATLIAQQAQADARAALAAFNEENARVGALSDLVFQASNKANALSVDHLNDEALARTLLSTYPGLLGITSAMTLLQNPSGSPLVPAIFPPLLATGLYASDALFVRNTGEVVYVDTGNGVQLVSGNTGVNVRLNLVRELGTGQAIVQLGMTLIDQRDAITHLGEFADEATITVWPMAIGGDTGEVLELCSGTTGHRVYGASAEVTYAVGNGVAVPLVDSAVEATADDVILGDALLDVRKDFNINGYAGTTQRKPVKFTLGAGSDIVLSFKLSSPHLAEVLHALSVTFQLKFKAKRQDASGVTVLKLVDMTNKPRSLSGSFV
jgi:hypothetical protein